MAAPINVEKTSTCLAILQNKILTCLAILHNKIVTCLAAFQNKFLTCLAILQNKIRRGTLQSTYIATSTYNLFIHGIK
jgi:hypothetical protein